MKCSIVLASDSNYAMPLATTLRSLTDSNRAHWPLEFYVIHDGMSETLRRKVVESQAPGSAIVEWIEIDLTRFERLLTMPGISKMTFARLMIPELIPKSVERVLYLDSDTLVLGDLAPLFAEDLREAPFGAVMDGIDPLIQQNSPKCFGAPRVEAYFNAGVLLIDLKAWRACRISEHAIDYLHSNPATPFADQDALNYSGDKHWRQLPSQWNYQKHRDSRIEDIATEVRPRIIHFVTGLKPWRAKCLNLNSRLYDRYRSRTAFSRGIAERCADGSVAILARINRQLNRFAWWRKVRLQLRDSASALRTSP
jgi:lipopolysaccharide biosynthesis glycosyltransferase